MLCRAFRPFIALYLGAMAVSGLLLPPVATAQSVPAERPRARPPSALTGWADWEKGEEMLKRLKVPPAPPRPPAEAMKTFRLAPGYRLELVAAEPMVQNPIFLEFDADGRIWRVVHEGRPIDRRPPRLSKSASADLVQHLNHPNGW